MCVCVCVCERAHAQIYYFKIIELYMFKYKWPQFEVNFEKKEITSTIGHTQYLIKKNNERIQFLRTFTSPTVNHAIIIVYATITNKPFYNHLTQFQIPLVMRRHNLKNKFGLESVLFEYF